MTDAEPETTDAAEPEATPLLVPDDGVPELSISGTEIARAAALLATGHGSFAFNPRVFPDPEALVAQLHADGMRVMLHVVDPPLHLHGTVAEGSGDPDSASGYWNHHAPADRVGVDGWWPDVGDMLDPEARQGLLHDHVEAPAPDREDHVRDAASELRDLGARLRALHRQTVRGEEGEHGLLVEEFGQGQAMLISTSSATPPSIV